MDRDPPANIERLIEEGLDLFHSGLVDHAVAVWTEVLHMEPNEPRALEYLRQAGVNAEDTGPPAELTGTRKELEQLLAERRYEEALELLFAARRQNPDAIEISRGIQLLKQRLVRRYLHQIGNLDHVPGLTVAAEAIQARKPPNDEQSEVLRLVDGISSFGDIAHESRLGRFETFRTLSSLVTDGILTATPEGALAAIPGSAPAAEPAPVSVVPTPTPTPVDREPATPNVLLGDTPITSKRSRAPNRIGWVLLCVIGALCVGGAVLYVMMPSEETTVGQTPDTSSAAAAAVAPPQAVAPPALPDEAAEAATAPTEAASAPVEIDVQLPPEPAPAVPASPPRRQDKPGRQRVRQVAPSPRATVAPPRAAAPPPGPKVEPTPADKTLPSAAPAAPTQAPLAEVAKSEAPPADAAARDKDATTPPATPAPTPLPRLDATATVASTTVQGPLTRSEVDRALQRVVPSLRACYIEAATLAGHNAPAAIKVTFILDETGLARSAEAASAALPGLSDCLRDVVHQVRTQVRPDVGVVYVTATVTFAPLGP